MKGKNCTDSPTDCSAGDDAVEVRGSHHVWFDHVDVSDGSDGNLDITQGSDYVTVSFSKFWYSGTGREHRFSNLIGSADNNPIDEGKLKVTWHHNWWAENADQRMPRTRYGLIHVFNNLYTSSNNSYCANAGFQAQGAAREQCFSRRELAAYGGKQPAICCRAATSTKVSPERKARPAWPSSLRIRTWRKRPPISPTGSRERPARASSAVAQKKYIACARAADVVRLVAVEVPAPLVRTGEGPSRTAGVASQNRLTSA